MQNEAPETRRIDDITWNDLGMDRVYEQLNQTKSTVGAEVLKNILRSPSVCEKQLSDRSSRADFFQQNERAYADFQKVYKELGRVKKYSFYDYIYKIRELPKRSSLIHYILIILLLASIGMLFVKPIVGILGIVIMVAVNIIVYFRVKAKVEMYFNCMKYLVSMVIAAKKAVHVMQKHRADNVECFHKIYEELEESIRRFASLKRGSWMITNSVSGSLADVVMDYVRMLFHVDLIKFNSMRRTAIEQEAQVRLLYESLGELESCMSIAAYRKELPYYCIPDLTHGKEIHAEGLYHPLVQAPVSNDIRTERSVLLTGSNASGKSTFLKSLAISQLFAQTICTCPAKSYRSGYFQILSSMALNDNILNGESYFVVEIKSLKRIFDCLGDLPVLCFVDEVLRGTNTVERIAASVHLLKKLTTENALVFAATHDRELTELLADCMDNYHFSETVADGEVHFDYVLKKGSAASKNAILLMKNYGFSQDITEGAREMADRFIASGKWS